MARKSPWQQFADNFDSTYSTFNTMFSDIEEGRIMSEEPEELQSGIGSGPRSQYQVRYGGKIYNEEITPEKLRGLRNQRLIDNMNKWGDTEGAMKLQLDQANLRKMENEALLAEGTLKAEIEKANLVNQGLSATTAMTEATMQIMIDKAPIEQRQMIAQAYGFELDNEGRVIDNRIKERTEDSTVTQAEAEASSAVSAAEISAMEAKDMKDTSYLRRQEQRTAYQAAIEENKAKKIGSKVALSENYQKLAVNDMMADFRDLAAAGEFVDADGNADNQAAKDWIVGKLYNINPTLADDMQANYNSNEVAVITHSSTMFKTKAMDAYTKGGVQGLSEAINNLNGVDDTRFEIDEESGEATIWAVDSETGKDIRKIVTGNPKPGGTFEMNLQQVLDPAAAMDISKAYHDDLKVQAEIMLKEAETEYTKEMAEKVKAEGIAAGKEKKEFDKEDFLIRLLIEDSENQLAWQGLVGMDLTAEEVNDMILQEKMRVADKPKAENLDDGLSSEDNATPDTEDETETKSVVASGSLQDQISQLNSKINSFAANSQESKAAQAELAKLNTVEGLTESIAALQKEIDALPRKANGDFELGKLGVAGAGTKKKAIDDKVKLLADMKASLESMSKGLGG